MTPRKCPHCGSLFAQTPGIFHLDSGYGNHERVCRGKSEAERAFFRTHRKWPKKPEIAPLRVGDAVEMTPTGRALAKERRVLPTTGRVAEVCRRNQLYVRRDGATGEWWPAKAWRRLGG